MKKSILSEKQLIEALRRRDVEKISFEQIAKELGARVSVIANGVRKYPVIHNYLADPSTPLSGAGGFYENSAIGMKGVRQDGRTR